MRSLYQKCHQNGGPKIILAGVMFVVIQLSATAVVRADEVLEAGLNNTPSAFVLFREKAIQDDVEAQYNLGVMYETGWSVEVDNKKAVRWFHAAARQGDMNAQLRLGMLYYLGLGADQSNIKGEKWIRKAAKQGQFLAQKMNDVLFVDELPGELSPSSVMLRVRTAYLENESGAVAVLESLLRESQQYARRAEKQKNGTTIRERRAQRGTKNPVSPGLSMTVGVKRIDSEVPSFIGDKILEDNRTQTRGSVSTIRLQAENGVASAQYNLGRMYELGIKLPIDKKRAMEWYEKAAEQGFAAAEYRLGISLLYGADEVHDEPEGKKWLASAASHGQPAAKNMMTILRDKDDDGIQHGISLAVRWYFERALEDDGEAAFHLGKIYEYGWGVKLDIAEAIKWYRGASQAGNAEAKALADNLQSRLVMPARN